MFGEQISILLKSMGLSDSWIALIIILLISGYYIIKKLFIGQSIVVKTSRLLFVYCDYISNSLFWLCIVSPVIYFIVGISLPLFGISDEAFLKYIFAYSLCIGVLIENFFSKKYKKSYSDIMNSIIKKKLRCHIFIALPKVLYLVITIIVLFWPDKNFNFLYLILIFSFVMSLLYFSAIQPYNKYKGVILYFKNATPPLSCCITQYSEDKGFISISEIDEKGHLIKTTKYNCNDILKIEMLGHDVELVYEEHLNEYGFNEQI